MDKLVSKVRTSDSLFPARPWLAAVMRGDVELLAFGDAVAQVEGFLQVIGGQAGLIQIIVINS